MSKKKMFWDVWLSKLTNIIYGIYSILTLSSEEIRREEEEIRREEASIGKPRKKKKSDDDDMFWDVWGNSLN